MTRTSPERPRSTYDQIYRIVRQIPRGRVATYGQVAKLAGLPGQARLVGYALSAAPEGRVPWQRVVNARGGISLRSEAGFEDVQRALLEAEGVRLDPAGRISLARFQWRRGSA